MSDLTHQLTENAPLLAQQTLEFLKPQLLAAAGALADQARAKAGETVAKIISWLKSKLTRPAAQTALDSAVKSPNDHDNWADLLHHLTQLLQSNPALRQELAALLGTNVSTTTVTQTLTQNGSHNIATQLTGKQNTINITRP